MRSPWLEGIRAIDGNTTRRHSEDAQKRIRKVVAQSEQIGQIPYTATARAKLIVAQNISTYTVYRHLELWDPLHQERRIWIV